MADPRVVFSRPHKNRNTQQKHLDLALAVEKLKGAGEKEITAIKMKESNKSNDMIKYAIKRMIPKGPLGRQQLSNCKIYSGSEHSHQAQNPTHLDISKLNRKNIFYK